MKPQRKTSIRRKLLFMVLIFSLLSLSLTTTVGVTGMLRIRRDAVAGSTALGRRAADDSENALMAQMLRSLQTAAEAKVALADAQLGRFSRQVTLLADYISGLYADPDGYADRPVLPPDAAGAGRLTMQLYRERGVSADGVAAEAALLGNTESVFRPLMERNADMLSTVYLATESGFMISCDRAAELAENDLYDFSATDWYQDAKTAGAVRFTDTYDDAYGRGLCISCCAPFYGADGRFMGVVSLDILLEDLIAGIINTDVSKHAVALLTDGDGAVIAAPEDAWSVCDERLLGSIIASAAATQTDGVIYAAAPVTVADWKLVIAAPVEDVVAPVTAMRESITQDTAVTAQAIGDRIVSALLAFVVTFALVLAAVLVLSGRSAKRLAEPVLALQKDIARVFAGDLDYRAEVRSNDEIGDLTRNFNEMTKSLRSYIGDLTAITAEKERTATELSVARSIQEAMLPKIFPTPPDCTAFALFASMDAAKEVGGDFYDFFYVDEAHFAVLIADVSGKGVPAAMFMVVAKTLIKNNLQSGLSPKAAMEKTNAQLCENNDAGMFVTAWLGVVEIATGHMEYINAGHNPPLVRSADGAFAYLKPRSGLFLGGMEGVRYQPKELILDLGDELFLYTDGVTEAQNTAGAFFGEARLRAVLDGCAGGRCAEQLQAVRRQVDAFAGAAPQFDDITMLALKMSGDYQSVTVPAGLEALEQVSDFAADVMEAQGCSAKVVTALRIVIDELGSNIARYSGSALMTVGCAVHDGMASLRFCDEGKPYDPRAAGEPDTTLGAAERSIGGLGIMMTKKLTDCFLYENRGGKNITVVRKKLS